MIDSQGGAPDLLQVWRNRGNIASGANAGRDLVQIAIGELSMDLTPVQLPLEARAVTGWTAAQLGVHPAIGHAGIRGHRPPDFILRPHDRELRRVLESRLETPRLIVLVGASCTGKSRSAVEAVHHCLPGWRLAPFTVDQVGALRTEGIVRRGTVVWLRELTACLNDPRACAVLLDVLAADVENVVLIGEVSAETSTLIDTGREDGADDLLARVRCLLGQATRIEVPEAFTDDEFRRAKDRGRIDLRLRTATETAEPGHQVTQVLAGGIPLARRISDADPVARAVIHAAMDARRLGFAGDVSAEFLKAAAAGYLPAHVRQGRGGRQAKHGQLRKVIKLWRRSSAGGLSPLRKTGHSYALHDYVADLGGRTRRAERPPLELWKALDDEVTDGRARTRLAREAERRGLFGVAWTFGLAGSEADDPAAVAVIARQFERSGRGGAAEELWRRASEHGDAYAQTRLAERLEERGDAPAAEELWRRAAESGSGYAVFHYAHRLRGRGGSGREEAWALVERQAENGDPHVVQVLVDWLREDRREKEIPGLLRRLRGSGRVQAAHWLDQFAALPDLADAAEELDEIERRLRPSAAAGYLPAMCRLADVLDEQGRTAAAEDLWRRAAHLRSRVALRALARRADEKEAYALLQTAAADGDTYAMSQLALRSERSGDTDEAEDWWRRASGHGDYAATCELVRLLTVRGRLPEVERCWRTALENRQSEALPRLAAALDPEEAGRLVGYGIEPGGATAEPWDLSAGLRPAPSPFRPAGRG